MKYNASELASALQDVNDRILELSNSGKRIPQLVYSKLPRVRVYVGRKLNEVTSADCEKILTQIDNALTFAETKEAPKATVYISEKFLDEAAMLRKAGIYAQKKAELVILEENYQRRKEELIKALSEAEDKIPMAQHGEFSALIKQLEEVQA